jgi:uncharacterized membrane protein YtjA (UPF0391 family)
MLHYAIVFLVIALIAALFGFGGIAAGAVEIAKVLFFIFVIMAIVAFVISIGRKRERARDCSLRRARSRPHPPQERNPT